MQEQFEDLIIDNSVKKDKQKQLLFKIILFVVIVLIVALAFKILNAPSSDKKDTLPPEPSVQMSSSEPAPSQFEPVTAQVQDFADDEFGSISERLSAEHNVPVQNITVPPAQKPLIPAPAPKPAPAPVVAPTPAPAPAPAPVAKPTPAAAPKPSERSVFDTLDIKSLNPAPANPAPSKQIAPQPAASGAYIQVYAGKKIDPKSHEIKLLSDLGLQYQIISGNGMQRVIVGPYSAADKAQALKFIREKVKKDAFFYHKK